MRRHILYLINVNWNWIKQRPHFIAENLVSDFDVTVYERSYLQLKPSFLRKQRVSVKNSSINNDSFRLCHYYFLPFYQVGWLGKSKMYKIANNIFLKCQYRKIAKHYDVIWASGPDIFQHFNDFVPQDSKVIYDCMDDYLEFPAVRKTPYLANMIKINESCVIERSDLIIYSADYLKRKVEHRYHLNNSGIVINNAINEPKPNVDCEVELSSNLKIYTYPLVYIGTVSEWFDFDIILNVLDYFEDINLLLVGPICSEVPQHPRIIAMGPVKHDVIFRIMEFAWALIMPFKVNELVKSVNPVKLYEYIYSGKPVVSVKYGETEKFAKYVHLYKNESELKEILFKIKNEIIDDESKAMRKGYALANTWKSRNREIVKAINSLF